MCCDLWPLCDFFCSCTRVFDLPYFIFQVRTSSNRDFSTDMRIACTLSRHKNVVCYCTWVLPVGEFHICEYSAQLYSRLTWRKLRKERLGELKPLLLLRFWCVCSLRETSFSDVSTNLKTLALLCQFTAEHVSDVNTSIFRSLRLLGALLCRL